MNIERGTEAQGSQGAAEIIEPGLRPFANEFGGDVQVVQRAPLDGCFGTQPSQQPVQTERSFRRQIKGCEESHGK